VTWCVSCIQRTRIRQDGTKIRPRPTSLDSVDAAAHASGVSAEYLWGTLRFAPPPGLRDDTLVTFTAAHGRANLTIARDDDAGALEPYARAQEQALVARRLKGYRATLTTTKLGKHAAVVVERTFVDGRTLVQRQVFVAEGRAVVIVTGTAHEGDSAANIHAVDDVVTSLSFSSVPGASR
jgi:hypothetical protein